MITLNAGLSACETASAWRMALRLFEEIEQHQADVISFGSLMTCCARGGQWRLVWALQEALRARKLQENAPRAEA